MKFFPRIFLFFTFLTQTGSAQWVQTNGPLGGEAKCFTVVDTTLFVGTEVGVFRSTDNGQNWVSIGPSYVIVNSLAVIPSGTSGMNIFAAHILGGVYRTTDNGTSWSQEDFGLENRTVNILAAKDTNLFAGTEDGVFLSQSNGDYWVPSSDGLINKSIRSLTVIEEYIYAGTDSGLFVSTNNGANWLSTGMTSERINAVAAMGSDLFAGTDTNGVYLSTNSGANWQIVSTVDMTPNTNTLAVIDTNLFVGTIDGIYRTPTKGDYWIPATNGLISSYIYSLNVKGSDIFASTYSGVFISSNNGANWTAVNTGLKTTVVLALAKNDQYLFAGTRGGMHRSNNYGVSWSPLETGWVFSIAVDGNNIYAGAWGHLFYSTDNGESWDFLQIIESKGRISSLALMDSYIFAGAQGGGVFRIEYNAGLWTIFSNGQPDTLVNALAVIGTDLFAGTKYGIYVTSNHGVNWTPLNNQLSNLEVSSFAVNGSNFFAGTRGGGVFLSTDTGNSWTPVNNGLTGLALDVLSFTFSGNDLFVSTWRGGVYLSTNKGTSWTSVNTGRMSLDYGAVSTVHSLAVVGSNLYAGTRGAGVWQRPLSEMVTATEESPGSLPLKYSLRQNYPNPFNPVTTINYAIPKAGLVVIKVFDLLGREVETLVNEEKAAGNYNIQFNGSSLSNGIYFYRMRAGDFFQTKKLVLLK